MKNSFNQDIEKKLQDLARINKKIPRYLPTDYYNLVEGNNHCYNLKIPQIRNLEKEIQKKFTSENLSIKSQFNFINNLWLNGESFEAQALALFWLESQETSWLVENTRSIVKWVERIHNWAHSDTYSGVLARIFEAQPSSLKPTFLKWNSSIDPWKRRNSMVGLMLYSRMRKTHPSFQFCIQMVDSQKTASEYYVQKAYGWTLREIYNVYPKETFSYLKKNAKIIAPAAWYAATEKLNKNQKTQLMKLRKS